MGLLVLTVTLEKDRVRLACSVEASPRYEPRNSPFSQADQPLENGQGVVWVEVGIYLQGRSTLHVEEDSGCSTVEVATPETDAVVEA